LLIAVSAAFLATPAQSPGNVGRLNSEKQQAELKRNSGSLLAPVDVQQMGLNAPARGARVRGRDSSRVQRIRRTSSTTVEPGPQPPIDQQRPSPFALPAVSHRRNKSRSNRAPSQNGRSPATGARQNTPQAMPQPEQRDGAGPPASRQKGTDGKAVENDEKK